ncbi:hypothetical protein Flavo103_12700 [Flavobacterium collinsii]|uniref:hypothetical protein n=1 Tax=Flavobacterium collinsii TaxID=1114861 RepID=UPI0022C58690|nr:hypothetical protein [Flavobacterium collinsii]GIQ58134.1 hypothetical protein Flavo103_12700 [Flavobacterium collinsii]
MFIILVFSFFGLCILVNLILYLKNSFIPKSFILIENEIVSFEERIKWRDTNGNPSTPEIRKTYYVPIVEYTYNDKKHVYHCKIPIMLDSPNFNLKMLLYINPESPTDARHRFKK